MHFIKFFLEGHFVPLFLLSGVADLDSFDAARVVALELAVEVRVDLADLSDAGVHFFVSSAIL